MLPMFQPSPRLGPAPTAPDSSPDRQAAHYERRLLLAEALGNTSGLNALWKEYWHFLQSCQRVDQLQTLIPGSIPISVPVACTPDRERAIRAVLQDTRPEPGNKSRNPILIAYGWYTVGEYRKSLFEIEELTSDGDLSVELEVLMALCHLRLQRWPRAHEWFQHAALVDSKCAGAFAGMGFALRSMGRPNDALVQYRKAALLDPTTAELHYLTGDALNCLEEYGKAHQAFQRAMRLAPENQLYREHHAEALQNNWVVRKLKGKRNEPIDSEARARSRGALDWVPSITQVITRSFGKGRKRRRHSRGSQALSLRKKLKRRLALWGLSSTFLIGMYGPTLESQSGLQGFKLEQKTGLACELASSRQE